MLISAVVALVDHSNLDDREEVRSVEGEVVTVAAGVLPAPLLPGGRGWLEGEVVQI